MPLYEYCCVHCNTIFTIMHGFDESLKRIFCGNCKQWCNPEKLISKTSFRLSWRNTPHPGKRTPVKEINGQLYDENSYAAAKSIGRFDKNKKSKKVYRFRGNALANAGIKPPKSR